MAIVRVCASREYGVQIEAGILERIGQETARVLAPKTALVITDTTVADLYGRRVVQSLAAAGIPARVFAFAPGEASKTLATVAEALECMAQQGLTRTDCVIALGGGIPGDVGGFCAASYMRGIRLVQAPTTFLAAIDSSVGGKTGVNLAAGKNLAGAFWQPDLVLCDPQAFATLPDETMADGAAEAVKYGVICGADLFDWLRQPDWRAQIERIVVRCVQIKADMVAGDEFDRGQRQLLNFGHTVGHAIEKCSGYTLTHGHAVSAGMVLASKMAQTLGLCSAACTQQIREVLAGHGLPVSVQYAPDMLVHYMLSDKKRAGDAITLVLPREIGQCILHRIPVDALPALLRAAMEV